MFEQEEKKLLELSSNVKPVRKPENIDQYIRNGIKLGIQRKRRNKYKLFVNAAAVLILVAFTVSVRVSPAFAASVAKIPGLQYIVKMINYDKGIKDIVKNDFVQHIGSSVEKDGIVVDIKDLIIDNSKAIIFYSIENKSDNNNAELASLELKNEKGEKMKEICIGWGGPPSSEKKENKYDNKIEIDFNERTVIPEKFIIDLKLKKNNNILQPVWSFEVPIDKSKFKSMEKTYNINQWTEIEGQKILFKTAKVTPTRISVDIHLDKNNTKKLLNFEDISIVNEKGEKWATIMNGVTGVKPDDENRTLYFQSNYYSESKELYISGSSIRAIDKDKSVVAVDINCGNIISAVDDKLKLKSVDQNNSEININFSLEKNDERDKKTAFNIFYCQYRDAEGKVLNSTTSEIRSQVTMEDYIYKISKDIKSPVYLTIDDYPERIKGKYKVKIK